MPDTDKAVLVEGIRKSFGAVDALRGISFEVGRGEVIGLLGPNGAGKTTTVDILSTLTRPDAGRAVVAGHDVVADPAGVRRSIMLTGQHVALDDMLTGAGEPAHVSAGSRDSRRPKHGPRATELLDQFALVDAARPVRQHVLRRDAAPHRHRLRTGGAAGGGSSSTKPTTGLDPRSRQSVWDLVSPIQGLRDRDAAHHAVPGGSRLAERSHHRDRSRHDHRRGHRRRAQGAHRGDVLRDRFRATSTISVPSPTRWVRCCPNRAASR
jgi:hypothetical protein